MSNAIATIKRRVTRIADQYYVQELNEDGTYKKIGKPYLHQTSAYAALGRLFEKACFPEVKE
jgi:hypothetical protein